MINHFESDDVFRLVVLDTDTSNCVDRSKIFHFAIVKVVKLKCAGSILVSFSLLHHDCEVSIIIAQVEPHDHGFAVLYNFLLPVAA